MQDRWRHGREACLGRVGQDAQPRSCRVRRTAHTSKAPSSLHGRTCSVSCIVSPSRAPRRREAATTATPLETITPTAAHPRASQTSDNRRFPVAETCPPMSRTSLTRFLIQQQHAGRINADLRQLIAVVARACTSISIAVSKGALGGVLGEAGTGNVQGEAQKKLDVISNEILLEANAWGGHLAACASEEMDHSQPVPDIYPRGDFLLLFDPLDGSSNIDVNVSVGTIFSVLRCPTNVELPGDDAFLQPGSKQIAAGYCIYGPSTQLVLTVGHGTHAFTLDRETGEFLLTTENMQI